jgi:hypothetical protein
LDVSKLLDLSKLKLAAGRVGSDSTGRPRGLYREHCAHCHGITGDGNGPTASFLNPYPRDYRAGLFKFKSTPSGFRPLHDDLKRIVVEGIWHGHAFVSPPFDQERSLGRGVSPSVVKPSRILQRLGSDIDETDFLSKANPEVACS